MPTIASHPKAKPRRILRNNPKKPRKGVPVPLAPTCDITLLLDRSGSMGSVLAGTISGVNAFLKIQREAPGEATFSLIQFDDQYEPQHIGVQVKGVEDISDVTFVPRGNTALLDAIGRTIVDMRSRLGDDPAQKVVLAIVTDGEENCSTMYKLPAISAMISEIRALGWGVLFLGANQDSIKVGASLGISMANSANYSYTSAGAEAAFFTTSGNVANFRATQCSASLGYSPEQRTGMLHPKSVDVTDPNQLPVK